MIKFLFFYSKFWLVTFFFASLLQSCSPVKYLKSEQYFLSENKIKIETSTKLANKAQLLLELSATLKQKPNEKIGFLNKRWIYYNSSGRIKRNFAEEPVIFDSSLAQASAEKMQKLLQKRGFLEAKVENKIIKKRTHWFSSDKNDYKSVVSHYLVRLNQPFLVDTLTFASEDTAIQRLLLATQAASVFKKNQLIDSRKYDQEAARINNVLKNAGYASFTPNFIFPTLDSTNYKVNILLEIQLPPDGKPHPKFNIGKISIYTNSAALKNVTESIDSVVNNYHFMLDSTKRIGIAPKSILRFFSFSEGDVYNQLEIDQSFQRINNSGLFRFVNVRSTRDSVQKNNINFDITLTPEKKMTAQAELELHASNNVAAQSVGKFLFGPALNIFIKNRNFLGRAETFSTGIDFGFDVDQTFKRVSILNFRIQPELQFPQYIDFYGTRFLGNNSSNKLYNILKSKALSKISATINYIKFLETYEYWLINSYLGFDLKTETDRGTHNWKINHIGVDYLNPTTNAAFDVIINDNLLLRNSFKQQLFTGFFFRDITHTYSQRTNAFGESWLTRSNLEVSGLEMTLANKLFRKNIRLLDTFEFSKYLRLELEGRYQRQFSPNSVLALRLKTGLSIPLSQSQTIPYIKQFFLGGPNSLRGWRIRELGPGAFRDTVFGGNRFYYQTGDAMVEGNIEYRFPIWLRLKGAAFLDIGNVWTLKNDPARPESKLPPFSQIWNQLAIGTGLGLRLDASFFVFRTDLGYKIKNPFPDERGQYFDLHRWSDIKFSKINFNIAIGYPF